MFSPLIFPVPVLPYRLPSAVEESNKAFLILEKEILEDIKKWSQLVSRKAHHYCVRRSAWSGFLWLSGMLGFFTESDCRGSVLWIEAKKIHGCEWRNGTARQSL